jgi:hypothetical protein
MFAGSVARLVRVENVPYTAFCHFENIGQQSVGLSFGFQPEDLLSIMRREAFG